MRKGQMSHDSLIVGRQDLGGGKAYGDFEVNYK